MVKTHALMESVSASLHQFLHSIDADLTKPQKKFLRDGVVGLLRAGRPIVCGMARKLPDQRTRFLSRLDRLESNLNRQSRFDQKLRAAVPTLWLPLIRKETPIILDLSDIAKPLARKMDYLATVRDGSTGQMVNGYWLAELYASVWRKNPVPILLEPFSHEQPFCRGQNPLGAVRLIRWRRSAKGNGSPFKPGCWPRRYPRRTAPGGRSNGTGRSSFASLRSAG